MQLPESLRFFIFLLYFKYSHKLLLGVKRETGSGGPDRVGVSKRWSMSAGEQHTAQDKSLSCDTHRPGSSELKGTIREKQASLW